jgi:galactose mutarotase-like enzyme
LIPTFPKKNFLFRLRLVDEKSGRAITIESTQKGLQFYTGNFLKDIKGHNGTVYQKHGALCLETQNYSDSVNNQVNLICLVKIYLSFSL